MFILVKHVIPVDTTKLRNVFISYKDLLKCQYLYFTFGFNLEITYLYFIYIQIFICMQSRSKLGFLMF